MDIPFTVLIVEDHAELGDINRRMLEEEGYRVLLAQTLAQARQALAENSVDLLLLDVLMPDGSGLEFCREVRAGADVHILFLTARAGHEDILQGLEAGADDYITKPYRLDELTARVKAAFRRKAMERQRPPDTTVQYGAIALDTLAGRATLNGQDLYLSGKEFGILRLLLRNKGRTLPAGELYQAVWMLPDNGDTRVVKIAISRLRKKLEDGGSGLTITNRRGEGYCLEDKK